MDANKYILKIKTLLSEIRLPHINMEDIKKFSKRFFYYLTIWVNMSKNSFMMVMVRKKLFFMFLLGKLLRFLFFAAFLFFLVTGSENLAGYSTNQVIFFFLTFNLVDASAQFLYREVYRFRHLVVTGGLDLVLAKPMSSLFRVLMGGADVIDLITIPPLIIAIFYIGGLLDPSLVQIMFYIVLIINGLIIATAFHIAVLSLGIITFEIDHTIMIYRDIINLGRLPLDIYKQPLKGVLTYLIPVGVMISLPAKALMGLVSFRGVFLSLVLGILLLFSSVKFWRVALKSYTSASS